MCCWGHLCHAAIYLLNWYKMACMANYIESFGRNLSACFLCMCNLGRTGIFTEELLRFQHKILLYWCLWMSPAPPNSNKAEMCRNIGICCSFRAVTARGKHPGFVLFFTMYFEECKWLMNKKKSPPTECYVHLVFVCLMGRAGANHNTHRDWRFCISFRFVLYYKNIFIVISFMTGSVPD